jgi:hypothetical protein
MKTYIQIAWGLLAVSAASCTTDHYIYISRDLKLGRVASVEFDYSTDDACKAAATKYNHGNTLPPPINTNPLTYSFKRDTTNGKYEFRFVTYPSQSGKKIRYYEIDKKSDTDNSANRDSIILAIEELKKKGATILRDTILDKPINEKRAWRVVMYSARGIIDKDNNLTQLRGDFGVIVNPPYPP